jgi:branched-chain amino acid transport system substrate-binding protein
MIRSWRAKLALVSGLLTLVATTGCTAEKPDNGWTLDPIVLGTSLSKTGALGQFGLNLEAGYRLRVDEINDAGGIIVDGATRMVKLVVMDNRSDPITAGEQIRDLVVRYRASVLLGACTPPIVIPQAVAADQRRIPYITSCNPVRAFQAGNPTGWTYAWDMFFDEGDQAVALAKLLTAASTNKKIALFTDTSPDGLAARPLFKEAMGAVGIEVVGDYVFPVGTKDFSLYVNDAKARGAELVAGQMVPPDGMALWRQMKALSFRPKVAFVAKAAASKAWPKALGPIAEGTLSNSYWSPATGLANSLDLVGTLGPQFPDNMPDFNIAVLGYTVAAVAMDALQAGHSMDPSAINAAISRTDGDYPLGHIVFNTKNTASTPVLLTQWQNQNTAVIVPTTPGVTLQAPAQGLQ